MCDLHIRAYTAPTTPLTVVTYRQALRKHSRGFVHWMSRVEGDAAGVLCVGEDRDRGGFSLHMHASPLGKGLLHLQHF